jgi:hypothetical protein
MAGDFSVADRSGRGRQAVFSPLDQALIKAVACEVVAQSQQPLSRQSPLADVSTRAQQALGRPISRSTSWQSGEETVAANRSSHHSGPYTDPCELAHQVEIYFSIIQRKVLTPNDFANHGGGGRGCRPRLGNARVPGRGPRGLGCMTEPMRRWRKPTAAGWPLGWLLRRRLSDPQERAYSRPSLTVVGV